MKLSRLSPKSGGFTLVELLIVVIILAILAAVAIPQFSSSTDEAKLSALDSSLSSLRSAIDLYKQQHGHYPGTVAPNGGPNATVGAKSAVTAVNTKAALEDHLTMYTTLDGGAATGSDTNYKYGPYLKKGIPVEPTSNKSDVVFSTAGVLNMKADTASPGGWKYDTVTGQIIANTVKHEAR